MISPNIKIKVTDIRTAIAGEKILSKKIGKVSIAAALQRSSVTSIQWCWSITGNMRSVIRLTSGSPIAYTSNVNLSIEASPVVSPDITPAKHTQATETAILTQMFPT